jgi:hypothetical protein
LTLLRYVTEIAAVNQALLVVCLSFFSDASTWTKKWLAAARHGQSPTLPEDPRRDVEVGELLGWK